ncbi:MAG TPA: hypothetical protein VM163_11945 [bacterium]|nr:hypothetical protein [bacterium]
MRLRKRFRKARKRLTRAAKFWTGRQLLRAALLLIPRFPLGWIERLSDRSGSIAWHVTKSDWRRALDNMRLALPDLSEPERIRMCKQVARNLARNVLELLWIVGHPHLAADIVQVEGLEHIKSAVSRGRGVVVLSAHFGNFMMLCLRLALEDFPFSAVINMPQDPQTAAMVIKGCQEVFGMHPIDRSPRWASFRECLSRLKNGEVICLIMDEEARKGGVFVDFFGYQVPTPKGPAALAIRSGAKVAPAFAYNLPGGRQKIVVQPPLNMPSEYNDESVRQATAVMTKAIEAVVREDPEQWSWISHRWRKRLDKGSNSS